MKYLVMCIGNREGGDDSVGPYIADILKKENLNEIKVINAGTIPENYTGTVKKYKPENLVIIDAIDMNLKPAEIRIVPKEKIGVMHISTHGIPLSVLINYLEKYVNNIFLVGIQPEKMSGQISKSVLESANKIIENIRKKELKNINMDTFYRQLQ
jgi:hydrogenase 3 maturation protease